MEYYQPRCFVIIAITKYMSEPFPSISLVQCNKKQQTVAQKERKKE